MLPNKFKIIGLLIAIASLSGIVSRIAYLMHVSPVTATVTVKQVPGKAPQISGSTNMLIVPVDSARADKYYKSITQTIDSSGKVIKSVTKTKTSVNTFKDPIIFGFNLLLVVGLLICVLSREKIEDERIDKIRLIAFRTSFIIGIFLGMALLVLDYYKISLGAQGLIMFMLAGYFIVFLYLTQREASAE